ncbi:MAG: mechanosensitive ion channel domain-containing protein [Myxococcota bacterium]
MLVIPLAAPATGAPLPRRGKAVAWTSKLVILRSRFPELLTERKGREDARELLLEARSVFGSGRGFDPELSVIESELEAARVAVGRRDELRARVTEAPERLAQTERDLEAEPKARPFPAKDALEEELRLAEAELNRLRGELDRVESTRSGRPQRRVEITAGIERLEGELGQLDELRNQTDRTPETEEEALELALALARRVRQQEELAALRAELATDRAEQELLPKLVDLRTRQVERAEEFLTRLRGAASDYEQGLAEEDLGRARDAAAALAEDTPAFLVELAQENVELAARSVGPAGLVAGMREVENTSAEVEARAQELEDFYSSIRNLVKEVGLTPQLGKMLRAQRASLQNPFWIRRSLESRTDEVAQSTVALFEVQNRRKALSNPREKGERLSRQALGTTTATAVEDGTARATRLLQTQQALLEGLEVRYEEYIGLLGAVRAQERSYAELVEGFGNFLDARLVWIRSRGVFGPADILNLGPSLRMLASPTGWAKTAQGTLRESYRAPTQALWPLLLAAFLATLLLRSRARRRSAERGRGYAEFRPLLGALLTEVVTAGLAPLVLWGLSRWAAKHGLNLGTDGAAQTLAHVATLWFWLNLLVAFTRPGGLGELDFRWSKSSLHLLHKHLKWLRPSLLATWLPYGLIESYQQESPLASLSRLGLMAASVLLAQFVMRTLKPEDEVMGPVYARRSDGWLHQLRYPLYYVTLAVPVGLGGLAFFGYFFTAMVLQARLFQSIALLVTILAGRALLLAWLRQTRRTLVRRQYEATMEEAKEEGEQVSSRAVYEAALAEIEEVDAQTRQVFRGLTLIAVVFGLSVIWLNTLTALETLERVEIYPRFLYVAGPGEAEPSSVVSFATPSSQDPSVPTLGAPLPLDPASANESEGSSSGRSAAALVPVSRVSLEDLMVALLVLVLTGAAVVNLPGLVEILLLQRLPLDRGTRYAISTVLRYTLAIIGLLAALDAVALGWSRIQWLAAALTFGLGFGLQEIFANFVSGIIILFERPIRIGDVVTVGETSGRVGRVNMRATTIIDWDNKELIVPNREFITQQVVNWTLTNQLIRVQVDVGVAYGSDVELCLSTLRDVARKTDAVATSPAPQAYFLGFGDSTLNLTLFAHITSVDERHRVRDLLHRGVDRAFREKDITIAFPQLDVHLSRDAPASPPSGSPAGGLAP